MRKIFDAKNGSRSNFLKELAKDPKKLKKAGFSDTDILKMRNGRVPSGCQVHHKFPLDDSGTNDYKNLILIKNDPYHKIITNYQKSATSGMKVGDTRTLDWPVPQGKIYN